MSEDLKNFLGPELLGMWADGDRILASASGGFHDYSFAVFPFAKVYEGFLKKFFLKLGAINEHQYNSDHWRVGKALNPQLEKDLRHDESVYDRIVELPGGQILADALWNAWKEGRNRVFHYFPGLHTPLSFEKAQTIILQINEAMEMAVKSLNYGSNTN